MHHEAKDRDPVWDCTLIENMRKNKAVTVNVIYNWSDDDVWEFARLRGIKLNPLYQQGYVRCGCIGCPLATREERIKEFKDFPTYKSTFIKVFDKMLANRKAEGKVSNRAQWKNGKTMFDWWIENFDNVEGQIDLEEWLQNKEQF